MSPLQRGPLERIPAVRLNNGDTNLDISDYSLKEEMQNEYLLPLVDSDKVRPKTCVVVVDHPPDHDLPLQPPVDWYRHSVSPQRNSLT